MLNGWEAIIRLQHQQNYGLDEGLKEELAQSGGFTVKQLEEFLAKEGLE